MDNLKWRTARKVELTDRLIPNPNSQSELLQRLANVRVAFDSGLVHIDPREVDAHDFDSGNPEFEVYVLPAASVLKIVYMEKKKKPGNLAAV